MCLVTKSTARGKHTIALLKFSSSALFLWPPAFRYTLSFVRYFFGSWTKSTGVNIAISAGADLSGPVGPAVIKNEPNKIITFLSLYCYGSVSLSLLSGAPACNFLFGRVA